MKRKHKVRIKDIIKKDKKRTKPSRNGMAKFHYRIINDDYKNIEITDKQFSEEQKTLLKNDFISRMEKRIAKLSTTIEEVMTESDKI